MTDDFFMPSVILKDAAAVIGNRNANLACVEPITLQFFAD